MAWKSAEAQRDWARANPKKVAGYTKKWRENNMDAHREMKRRWRTNNRDRHLEGKRKWSKKAIGRHLSSRYKISESEYQKMLAEQNGVCAICTNGPGTRRLHIDHDHATGQVRGLLCHPCNIGIGMFKEREDIFTSAMIYLKASKEGC